MRIVRRFVVPLALVGCTLGSGCAASARALPDEITVAPAPALSPAAPAASPDARVVGSWVEHWAELTYHDRYTITLGRDGALAIEGRRNTSTIGPARFDGAALAFVQRTSFDVAYRLTLSADGKRLVGTATTPEGVFSVTWERERPTDVDLVEQGHLEY